MNVVYSKEDKDHKLGLSFSRVEFLEKQIDNLDKSNSSNIKNIEVLTECTKNLSKIDEEQRKMIDILENRISHMQKTIWYMEIVFPVLDLILLLTLIVIK